MISSRQWMEFKDSKHYKAIQVEFETWLADIHLELEDASGKCTDKELHRLGGNAEFIRRAINVVDILIERTKMDEEANNER